MATNMARNNPIVMAALEKNCFEHISLMAQEQVEIEFRKKCNNLWLMQTKSTSCNESTNTNASKNDSRKN